MFDELRFRFALWKSDRQANRAWRKHDIEYKAAKARRADRDEIDRLNFDGMLLSQEIEEDKLHLLTRHLNLQAEKLLIPKPTFKMGETHEQSQFGGGVFYTQTTAAALREAVRKERRDRSEVFRLWLSSIGSLIGALTGLIGVCIGFLALWYRLPK